ncbi:cilia-and flagella-associated protein 57 [Trichonephila inaurata madagascariensis]|uniref:Cilia-and flagella-associated protein 57 n=1 Tax=Trichonephila inaurata madagascariensis TaxID=2747483 RepID=A0A8X6ICG9_9ARAC|nr:cilia-and flagella-associated protein 57 [Trichonephila inaurata madagascariensis]
MDLYYSFGVSPKLVRNITFYDDKTLIFISGKLFVLFDLEAHSQKIIEIVQDCEVTALSRCEKHLLLAVRDSPPSIYLFNIESSTKRLFNGPMRMKSDTYFSISSSTSLKFIAAQGCEPDWLLVIWLSTTREVIAVFDPTSERLDSVVHDISFNAGEREELVVVGKNVFRLYECQDEEESETVSFSEIIFEKHEEGHEYYSIAWPQKESLAVGNSKGCTSSELLCVFAGRTLVIYKGEEISQYTPSRYVHLSPPKLKLTLPGELVGLHDFIMCLDISPGNGLICATTAYGQLLYLDLKKDENNHSFQILVPRQHNGPIIAMDVARGKPLVATCSEHL